MSKKALVLDLDGTAITKDYALSSELIELCDRLRERVEIIIATGRSASDGYRYYQKLKLNNYMICHNGAYIWNPTNNSVDYCNYMANSRDILQFIFENYNAFNIENVIVSSGMNTFALNKKNEFMCNMMYDDNLSFRYVSGAFMKELDEVHRIVFSCTGNVIEVQNKIKSIDKRIDAFGWMGRNDIVDISMINVNKYDAVKRVLSKVSISIKDVVAFGDGRNDIPLLRGAGIGIAMLNASDEVKKCADHITKFDNDNNGVFRYISENMNMFSEK